MKTVTYFLHLVAFLYYANSDNWPAAAWVGAATVWATIYFMERGDA